MKKRRYVVATDKGMFDDVRDYADARRVVANALLSGVNKWAQIVTYVIERKGPRRYRK